MSNDTGYITISEAIVAFIESYKDGIEVDTNHIADGANKYGLFKSPQRSVKEYINNSSYEVTEGYQFLIRHDAIMDGERIDAEEWLEGLQYWVDDYKYNYEYPVLANDRVITDISLTACPYPMEQDDNYILYQISLTITYVREREA